MWKNLSVLFLLSFLSTPAWSQIQMPKTVLVSVGDLKAERTSLWRRETCQRIHAVANQVSSYGVNITCREFSTENFMDTGLAAHMRRHDFHLRLTRGRENNIHVDATHWRRKHESDFETIAWEVKDDSDKDVTQEEALARIVANFFFYVDNEEAFKAGLLMNGLSEAKNIAYSPEKGSFVDTLTYEPISIDTAVRLYEGESERKKNYMRTGIQIGSMLSAGLAIYYKNLVYNKVDFDYGFTEGLKKKFITGEAILFDDNDKFANYGHAYAGMLYHQAARANGFNSLESFLVAFASSAAWEVLEYHEVFSINDMIITSVGGYVLGEAMYQMSCALLGKGGAVASTLGYTFSPVLAMNHGIDKVRSGDRYASQADCKKPRWSEISVHLGMEHGQKPYQHDADNDFFVGLHAEVVNIPGFGKEGKAHGLVYDTAMSKFIMEANGNEGMIDLRVVAQVVAAAYYDRNIQKDERGEIRGYEFALGIGSATTWNDRGGKDDRDLKPDTKEDFFGTINILGATAHANLYYKGFKIRAEFGMYGDFTFVKSYALEDLRAAEGLEGQNSVIQKRGYYNGLGTTAMAGISVEYGKWKLSYSGQGSQVKNLEGRERFGDQITRRDTFRDEIQIHRVSVSYSLTKNLRFQVSHEIIKRQGTINNGEYSKKGTENRTIGTLVYLF